MPFDGPRSFDPATGAFIEPTTTVVLHGALARKYGRRHQLHVRTAAEAAYALSHMHPGFREDFAEAHWTVVRGKVATGIRLTEASLNLQVGTAGEIHFLPAARGAAGGTKGKGTGKIILGAVLLVVAVVAALPTGSGSLMAWGTAVAGTAGLVTAGQLAFFGAAVLLAGISMVISPQAKNTSNQTDPRASFGLSGIMNSTQQGTPVPVVYGRTRVGSVVGSFGFEAVDYVAPPAQAPVEQVSNLFGTSGSIVLVNPGSVQGGGGGGKGGSSSGGASEAPNTLQSKAIIRVIDILSCGPIGGLVNGAKSIYFNNTPLMAADGSYNFQGVTWEVRTGTPNQDPVAGYPAAEVTSQIAIQVKQQQPLIRTVTSATANAARVTVRIPALITQDANTGDLLAGPSTSWSFEVRPQGGNWTQVVYDTLTGQKCTSPYQRSYRFGLPGAGAGTTSWDIRMTRVTADSVTSNIQNDTFWDAITVVTDHQLIYPGIAYCALTIDSSAFGSQIPTRSYEIDGVLVQVPLNYDPLAHAYSATGPGTSNGTWDGGSWKLATTSNPCWNTYDMLSNGRYGLGLPDSALTLTRYDLYTISQYCDGMVPTGYLDQNGNATAELRYAMNVAMTTQEDAFKVLQSMVSAFRGMVYWGAGSVVVTADMPTTVSSVLNPGNVIDGDFNLEGTSLKTRHTVARVMWQDPQNSYQPTIEVVEDFDQVVTLGQVATDITAFGCTSRGLAHRLGKWLLDTEKTQTETLNCKVGLEHLKVRPGDVVRQTDPSYVGFRMGGRCPPGSTTTRIKLDDVFPTTGELAYFLTVTLPDGTVADKVVVIGVGLDGTFNGPNNICTLQTPLPMAPAGGATWILSTAGTPGPHGGANLYPVEGRQFRILGVSEPARGTFALIGVNHDPNKFARVEYGLKFDPTPFSALNQILVAPLPPPSNVTARDYLTGVGTTTVVRATVSFTAVRDPRIVNTEVRAIGPEQRSAATDGSSYDFDNLALGQYTFGARSIGRDGRASIWVNADPITVDGTADAPPAVTGLTAIGGAMQVRLSWDKSIIRDLLQYEVWRAPAPGNGTHPFNTAAFTPTGTPAANGASLIAHIDSTLFIDSGDVLGPDEGWAYWVRAVNTTQVAGTFAGPVKAVTTVYLTDNLADSIKNTAPIAWALLGQAPLAVQDLTGVTGTEGQLAFQAKDQKLYRWDHTANNGAGGWVLYIPVVPDSAGKIPAAIVTGIQDAVIGTSLTQAQVNQVLNAVSTSSITDAQIAGVSGSKISGTLSNAQLPAGNVYEVDPVTGQAVLGINTAKLIGTINATKIVDVDPVTGNPVTGVSATRVVGTINVNQIPQVPTSKLLGTISSTQLGTNSVTTGAIAANAVTATALAAGAVTAEKIAVGSSTNVVWNASCVTTTDGWSTLAGISTGLANNLAGYTPAGEGCGYITSGATLSNGSSIGAVWVPEGAAGVPVVPGTWVEAQAMLGAHRVAGFVVIDFFDASGNAVPSSRITSARMAGTAGGNTLGAYALVWCKGQAPTGAATMRLGLLGTYDGQTDYAAMGGNNASAGTNPYVFWCRAVLGLSTPVAMASSTPQPYAPGGITEITGGVIKSGTIIGRNILAGSITTDKLSVGGGGNVIWNACCAISTDGWSLQQSTAIGTLTTAPVSRALKGFGAGELYITGSLPAGQVVEASWMPNTGVQGIAASAGQVWEAQALVIGTGCQVQLVIDCFDSSQAYTGQTLSNAITALTPGATDKNTFLGVQSEYTPLTLIATLPTGTAFIRFSIRMYAPSIAAGAQIYFTQAMLAQTVANATQVSTWSPGGLSQITGGMIQTDAISSRQIAANSITASELAVGSSANLIANSCFAVTTEGWSVQPGTGSSGTLNSCASAHTTFATTDGCGALDFTLAAGQYVDTAWQLVSVNPGDTYCLQALLLPINVSSQVYGEFYNTDGSHNAYVFGNLIAGQAVPATTAQGTLAPFLLSFVNGLVPAGATKLQMRIRVTSGGAGTSYAIFTRTGLGLTVPGATGCSPWTAGGVTQITPGLLQTNAVVARTIAAGAITADKLQIASSSNVIGNPTCPSTSWGWVLGYSTPASTVLGSVNGDAVAPVSYALVGEGTGCVVCSTTMSTSQYMYAQWDPDGANGVACVPGEWWECQAYIGAHRCYVQVELSFWDSSGTELQATLGTRVAGPLGGSVLSSYGFSWTKALAPANAARVLLRIIARNDGGADIGGGTAGSNPYLFFTRCVLGRSTSLPIASGALPQPYQIGGVTQVSGGQIKTGTIVANNIGAGQITANKLAVGSATNVIWNGCAYPSAAGWLPIQNDFTLGTFAPTDAFGLTGYGSGYMNIGSLASGASRYVSWSPNPYVAGTPYGASVPCSPGELWEAQALVMGHRCSVQVLLKFVSATAETLDAHTVFYTVAQPSDGHTAAKYTRASCRGTAPAGTVAVTMLLLMINDAAAQSMFGVGSAGSNAGVSPYLIWSQAGLGPVASSSMAQPLPWSPGGVTSINGGVLQTGTIIARHLAAGSITTSALAAASVTTATLAAGSVTAAKLTIGNPANCIWNPCVDQGSEGWNRGGFGSGFSGITPNVAPFVMDAAFNANQSWYLTGFGSAFTQYTGSTSSLVYDTQGFVWEWSPTLVTSGKSGVPAASGKQYGGSMLVTGGNKARAYLQIYWTDFNGNVLSGTAGSATYDSAVSPPPNGLIEDYYTRLTVIGTAPAGTCFAVFRVLITGCPTGASQPYIAFSKAQFGEMEVGATAVGTWVPGGVTTISGNMIKTGTMDAAKINAGTLSAATGFIANLTSTLITADNIKAKLINTNKLTSDSIDGNTITAGSVVAGAIGAPQIAAGAIRSLHLASDFALISSAQIGFATIQSLNVGDLQITGSKIAGGAVSNTATSSAYNGNTASATQWSDILGVVITKTAGLSGVVLFVRSINDFSNAGSGIPPSDVGARGEGA